MNQRQINQLKKHFRTWSGGGPPESKYQIIVYIDYAMECDYDRIEAEDALWDWMGDIEPDVDLYAGGSPRPTSFADFIIHPEKYRN